MSKPKKKTPAARKTPRAKTTEAEAAEEVATPFTVLSDALDTGDLEALDTLLRIVGLDPNAADDEGFTAFMSAVCSDRRSVRVLRRLVEAGADPRAASKLGYNAFHAAVGMKRELDADEETVFGILRYLSELGVPIDLVNQRGHTALTRAILAGTEIETRALCELGADPDASAPSPGADGVHEPLIFLAIEARDDAAGKVLALVKAGARLDRKDAGGLGPLERAERLDDQEVMLAVKAALGAKAKKAGKRAPAR